MTTKKTKQSTFSEAYAELEDITAWFEREDVDIDEGLKRFEKGVALAHFCKQRLTEVEARVREIRAMYESESINDKTESI